MASTPHQELAPIGSPEWTYQRFHALVFDRSDIKEFQVRSMAKALAENPDTFKHGILVPWMPGLRANYGALEEVGYHTLSIRLSPHLQGTSYRQAVILVIEEMLRHQIKQCETL